MQLTNSGEDWRPIFSDDGEKIVFFRGRTPHSLYAVDVDGKDEHILISADILISLNQGYDETTGVQDLSFVPNAHLLVLNTGKVDLDRPKESGPSTSNDDLLLINVDTSEINILLPPGTGGDFRVSPDGQLIAVQRKGSIDIVSIDGQMIHRNFVTYTPTHPYDLSPKVV